MRQSPHYLAIKSRALELLRRGLINDHPWEEIKAFARSRVDRWVLRNSVNVALCMARDEIDAPMLTRDGWAKGFSFNKGNFEKARTEIIRELRKEDS